MYCGAEILEITYNSWKNADNLKALTKNGRQVLVVRDVLQLSVDDALGFLEESFVIPGRVECG
jgi:hypothetical protein